MQIRMKGMIPIQTWSLMTPSIHQIKKENEEEGKYQVYQIKKQNNEEGKCRLY